MATERSEQTQRTYDVDVTELSHALGDLNANADSIKDVTQKFGKSICVYKKEEGDKTHLIFKQRSEYAFIRAIQEAWDSLWGIEKVQLNDNDLKHLREERGEGLEKKVFAPLHQKVFMPMEDVGDGDNELQKEGLKRQPFFVLARTINSFFHGVDIIVPQDVSLVDIDSWTEIQSSMIVRVDGGRPCNNCSLINVDQIAKRQVIVQDLNKEFRTYLASNYKMSDEEIEGFWNKVEPELKKQVDNVIEEPGGFDVKGIVSELDRSINDYLTERDSHLDGLRKENQETKSEIKTIQDEFHTKLTDWKGQKKAFYDGMIKDKLGEFKKKKAEFAEKEKVFNEQMTEYEKRLKQHLASGGKEIEEGKKLNATIEALQIVRADLKSQKEGIDQQQTEVTAEITRLDGLAVNDVLEIEETPIDQKNRDLKESLNEMADQLKINEERIGNEIAWLEQQASTLESKIQTLEAEYQKENTFFKNYRGSMHELFQGKFDAIVIASSDKDLSVVDDDPEVQQARSLNENFSELWALTGSPKPASEKFYELKAKIQESEAYQDLLLKQDKSFAEKWMVAVIDRSAKRPRPGALKEEVGQVAGDL